MEFIGGTNKIPLSIPFSIPNVKVIVNSEVKYLKIFTKKGIPIFLAFLILFTLSSIIPSCALADEQNMPSSPVSGKSFDQMKAMMTESVNVTLENLEKSKSNLDNESTAEAAEKLITDLKSIKEELSNAKTEDDLVKIRQELNTLFNAAPEESKNNSDFLPQNMGQRPNMQNVSENFSQKFKNRSEMRPEMMNNTSLPPEMMNSRSQPDFNAPMNSSQRPGPRSAGMEGINNSANLTAESGKEKAADSGFLGNLLGGVINALRSLFS
jgi:hypothetical protein